MIKVSFYNAANLPEGISDSIIEYSSVKPGSFSKKIHMINAVKKGIKMGVCNITCMDRSFSSTELRVLKNKTVKIEATVSEKVKDTDVVNMVLVYDDCQNGLTPIIVRTFEDQSITGCKKITVRVERKGLQSYVYDVLEGEVNA